MKTTEIKEVLIKRDGMTEEEATNYINEGMSEIDIAIASGDIWDVEDIFMDYFGLEPDYLIDALI